MSKIEQITNVGALKLQHASAAEFKASKAGSALASKSSERSTSFAEVLRKEVSRQQPLQFSKHAAQRVEERGIEMTDTLLNDLNLAVEKARQKGARDVVVIGNKSAFIVNVPNNVVVTTMSGAEMKENIFTNIDSAVLM